MKGRTRIGRWTALWLPVLIVVTLLFPLNAYSSGEVDLRLYVSEEVVFVGETVTFGIQPLPAEFSGAVVRWDFGDGSGEVTGWPVTHVYTEAGFYEVQAEISLPGGEPVTTLPAHIRVQATGNTPPQAQAQVSPLETIAGMPITFDAAASSDPDPGGEIIRVLWDFDDGTTAAEATVSHVYAQGGTYHVILTVTDNGEMDASTIVTVTIASLPTLIVPGINRVIPEPSAPSPQLEPWVLVDMGIWDEEMFPYYEYRFPLDPPAQVVAISNRSWLIVDPTDYEELDTPVVMTERFSVRNTSLLPRAHTSWAVVNLVVNGRLVEIPVAVTARAPQQDISEPVWELFGELRLYLGEQGRLNALVYSPRYTNGADYALGLITEYIIEDGYDGAIPREEFVVKVAELLMGEDANEDGVIGFTDQDVGRGVRLGQ